jgi:isocitrate lyase
LLETERYVHALRALTGNQTLQMAADANLVGQVYPDQSRSPCNSAPSLVRAINNAFRRAETHSILMRARSRTVRHIHAVHDLDHKVIPLRSRDAARC